MSAVKEVYDFLTECGVFYVATIDGDRPRVRQLGAICLFEDKIYVQTGHVKKVAQQIAVNPKVEICASKGGNWVRIECTLVEDTREEVQTEMFATNPGLQPKYAYGDGNTCVLGFEDATAYFDNFAGEVRILKL